jgi:hypothetical protein
MPRDPEQRPLWNSVVTLSTEFYDELVAHAVPIDLRALKALKGSPLARALWSPDSHTGLRKQAVLGMNYDLQCHPCALSQGLQSFLD